MMGANPDFKELFSIFNAEGVEYLVIGAHAVMTLQKIQLVIPQNTESRVL